MVHDLHLGSECKNRPWPALNNIDCASNVEIGKLIMTITQMNSERIVDNQKQLGIQHHCQLDIEILKFGNLEIWKLR